MNRRSGLRFSLVLLGLTCGVALILAGCAQITGLLEDTDDEPTTVELSVSVLGIGTTTPADPVTIPQDEPYEISVEPAAGFTFLEWEVYIGNGVVIDAPGNPETSVTLTDGNAVVRARLGDAEDSAVLTVEASDGGRTLPEGDVTATLGDPISIRAVASEGYEFDGWTITEGAGATLTAAGRTETTITLTSGDVTVHAEFLDSSIDRDGSLVVQAGLGGSAVPTGNHIIEYGNSLDVEATAEAGYTFSGWTIVSETDSGTVTFADASALSTTITLESGDATVEAQFNPPVDYTLTLQAGDGGSVTSGGDQTVTGETATTITASPDSGYTFDHWHLISGSGVTFGSTSSSSTTVTLTESDAVVEARFEEIPTRTAAISNVEWTMYQDTDSDGYWTAGLLNVDVTLSGDTGGDYSVRLYYTPPRATLPQLYESQTFSPFIAMHDPQAVSFTVAGSQLGSVAGIYDFSVRVYYGTTLIGSTGATPLSGVKFEP